jgi:UDP-N-acetylmuramoyl-tripeptide--D-alanyl-D-alanine ligase
VKPWELDEIRRAVKGKWLMRPEHLRTFNGRIATDSRKVVQGELFIAIKGERFDAHDFLKEIVGREPAAVVVHREPALELLTLAKERGVTVILVDDTIAALNRLAAAYRSNEIVPGFRAKVIAVGGSNGKTTTKRIIHALLSEKYGEAGGHASPKSFNNNIGMPLTLLEVAPSHEYVVLEIGTNAPGEIAALGEVCRPDIAVITSVGLEHLEKLGDLAGVAREEASIAPYVATGGTLIFPAETPELMQALKLAKAQRILIAREGGSKDADLLLTSIDSTAQGTSFSINNRGRFMIPLLGEHNAFNALVAIAVARRLGVTDEQIVAGLQKVQPADGRFQLVQAGPYMVINDAYNANPTSMEASLRTFAALPAPAKSRKVVILGDMRELGAATEAMHRQVGTLVGSLPLQLFIAIGKSMEIAAAEVREDSRLKAELQTARPKVICYPDAAAAREKLLTHLKKSDQILLKGSHSMNLESLLETLRGENVKPKVKSATRRRAVSRR